MTCQCRGQNNIICCTASDPYFNFSQINSTQLCSAQMQLMECNATLNVSECLFVQCMHLSPLYTLLTHIHTNTCTIQACTHSQHQYNSTDPLVAYTKHIQNCIDNCTTTYYRAQSISWYSLERAQHATIPGSFHSLKQ